MPRTNVGRNALKAVGQSALGGALGSTEGMHPNLGLHGAAASGNIGLIKFALENGQPANSNLNGILPLHAACSGGNEQAVRMLLLHGADVNAPRLKSKNSGGGAGVEGSTPLHFAAANGHLEVVRILLEAGARPAAIDKEGTQAEALASGNGHAECVKLLRSWIAAYGTNGLAGIVSSRETVSRDIVLGPAGYPRYPAGQQAAAIGYGADGMHVEGPAKLKRHEAMLRGQRSFDQLGSMSLGSRISEAGRGNRVLLKMSSNPNLKGARVNANASAGAGASVHPGQGNINSPADHSTAASPTGVQRRMADRSPSPLSPMEEVELAFSSAVTPAASNGNASATAGTGLGNGKETKRRPSLPSILEKAAHPAATLLAALGTGAGTPTYTEQDPPPPHSPTKMFSKLASKRSLSNMLRKATGNDKASVSVSSSGGSLAASGSQDATSFNATMTPARPPRSEQRTLDSTTLLPDGGSRAERSHTVAEGLGEEKSTTARQVTQQHRTRSDAAAIIACAVSLQPRLRGSASSSALSADVAARYASRARSSSNEQTMQTSKFASSGRMGAISKASLDITRAEQPFPASGLASEHYSGNGQRPLILGRPMHTSNVSAPATVPRRRQTEDMTSHEHESSSDFMSSDGSLSMETCERPGSRASRPGFRGDLSHESRTHKAAVGNLNEAEFEDDQEFLGDTVPMSPEEAAGEHHDVHHLPAGLRTLSAMRGQEPSGGRLAGLVSNASNPSSPSAVSAQRNRNRSTSSLSAVSTGSQSGAVSAPGNLSDGALLRDSPGLHAASQALSIADEVGMIPATMTRPGRSSSHAESVSSRPSTSSLRSNYLSAAEQAQAILNQEVQFSSDVGDGAPLSLAAQLAAYGEALAQERKRAGEVRSGPSPSLSGRASSAALKTALPSVSEDQSPALVMSPANVGRRNFGTSTGGTFTGQTYPRALSRRPHSSEGTEAKSSGQCASFHTDVLRSKTINESSHHPGLKGLFVDSPTTPNMESESRVMKKGLGSPLSPRPPASGNSNGDAALRNKQSSTPRRGSANGNGNGNNGPSNPSVAGRASEDLLRQRPTILTWNSDATLTGRADSLPKTPVMTSVAFTDGSSSSPRGSHRHSPSAPSQLSSYAAARVERSPNGLMTSHVSSGLVSPSIATSDQAGTPPVPPRKDSHLSATPSAPSNGLLTPDIASLRSETSGSLSPTSSQPLSPRYYESGAVGLGFESSSQRTRPSWDVPRRPSMNVLRSGTGSYASQITATGPDERYFDGISSAGAGKSASQGAASGKRRLMRNLLTGIKNSTTGNANA